ncbi:threonine synthase [Nowakowskiella sp. JEL0078]|nr:threonine synthase [Nowakowskiella sp. JEL0078]
MKYQSTRGKSPVLSFEDAVFQGLAPDGGLYIPTEIPKVSLPEIVSWAKLDFPNLASKLFRFYISPSEIPDNDLLELCQKSFSTFSHKDVTPVKKLPNVFQGSRDINLDNLFVLELFHGPTFAFKDVALQFVGNLFEYFLTRKNKEDPSSPGEKEKHWITVVGATSGDTGGAAIYGLRGKKNVNVFILHPKGRISSVQEQQMTSVTDENVFNVSVEGTFDDCQETVKSLFSDVAFRNKYHLAAINSINWARILAQTSYYFFSYFQILRLNKVPFESAPSYASLTKIQYSVPTGNFGDVLAGYFALRMGLPIYNLIIATNANDILHRFLETGTCSKPQTGVAQTLSPAMDILVSSNFERMMWYLARGDSRNGNSLATNETEVRASQQINEWMQAVKSNGFTVSAETLANARAVFSSAAVSDVQTTDAINRYYHHQFMLALNSSDISVGVKGYILDPHTAVSVVAAEKIVDTQKAAGAIYTVCLSTASPGKFPEAVMEAINENVPVFSYQAGFAPVKFADFAPKQLVELEGLPKRCIHIPTDGGNTELALERVRKVIVEKVLSMH